MGIINGYPDGGFHPNAKITRAEFATIAARFFEVKNDSAPEKDIFSDISDSWANSYINLAYQLKVVDGYPDGTFKPENSISRTEAMQIVNNTLRRNPSNDGLLPDHDMVTWPDNADKDKWYYATVQEATNSHEYKFLTDGSEKWTKELPVRDWEAFEKEWSTANSAANPGEVVN